MPKRTGGIAQSASRTEGERMPSYTMGVLSSSRAGAETEALWALAETGAVVEAAAADVMAERLAATGTQVGEEAGAVVSAAAVTAEATAARRPAAASEICHHRVMETRPPDSERGV